MEFIASQRDLVTALQPIIGIVPQRSTLPILSYLLLEADEETLTISATDLEVSMLSKLLVNVSMPGAITLPGRKFVEIIRELPDDSSIKIWVEGGTVTISCEVGLYRILGLPKEEFPRLPEETSGEQVKVNGLLFKKMVEKTLFAVSKDETRPILNGVLWQIGPEELRMVATDGHRLARIACYLTEQNPEMNIIIPSKALSLLQRFVSEDVNLQKVTVGENHIIFDLGNIMLFSRLIEGSFPQYEEVIPRNNDKRLIVDKNLLIASLRRVSILADSITHLVRFTLQANKIKLSTINQELGGEAQEEIPAEYYGEDMDIGYNAYYILDILRQMDSEQVIFDLGSPLGAGIVYPHQQAEGEDYFCLVMPIRLTD